MRYKNLLQFNLSPQEINEYTDTIIADSRRAQDLVGSLNEQDRNFSTVVLPLAYDESVFSTLSKNVIFPSYVAEDQAVRDASTASKQKISDFGIESGMRRDLYEALTTVRERQGNELQSDEKRLLDRMIRDFERNGLGLSQELQQRVKELKERMSKLSIEFQKNLNEDKTQLLFTEEELEGCPQDFIQSLSKDQDSGKLIVTLKVPDVVPVMKYAKKPETRRKMDFARSSQCQEPNVPLFEETLQLRQEIARLLGFDTHASYVLDIRMAKKYSKCVQFLE